MEIKRHGSRSVQSFLRVCFRVLLSASAMIFVAIMRCSYANWRSPHVPSCMETSDSRISDSEIGRMAQVAVGVVTCPKTLGTVPLGVSPRVAAGFLEPRIRFGCGPVP